MEQTKHRTSNFEVLRILSMCGIIAIHYINGEIGGAIQNAVFPNFSWFFMHILSSFCVPLVNGFVLISGYFLICKNIFSLKKTVNLLTITAFYGVLGYVISLLINHNSFSFKEVLFSAIPFFKGERWFVETYIILILFAPFLNRMFQALSKSNYEILICIQMLIFSIWYSFGFSAPLLDDGYGIINFITLYMIGGYLRLHGKDSFIIKMNKRKLLILFIGISLLTFGLSYFTNPYGYAYITNIFGATVLFVFFMKWDFGEKRYINKISNSAFDVYFIHSDSNTSLLLFYEILGAKFIVDTPWTIVHLIMVIVVIWIIGFCVCQIRKYVFSITFDRLFGKIGFLNKDIEI